MMFFVPGFVFLFVYNRLRGISQAEGSRTIASFAISYVIRTVLDFLGYTPSSAASCALVYILVALISASVVVRVLKSKWYMRVMERVFSWYPHITIWSRLIGAKNGTLVIVKLKSSDVYYAGYITHYGDNYSDPWIALSRYSINKRDVDDGLLSTVVDFGQSESRIMILNSSDIESVEFIDHKR